MNAPLFRNLMETMYEPVNEDIVTMLQGTYNHLGWSTMRLLPKQNGARPIVNLSKKQTLRPNFHISVNGLLRNVYHILSFEKVYEPNQKRKSKMFGSAAMGKNDIYRMLKEYKERFGPLGKSKLYFCKVDIQGCFNTIDQSKLMELVEVLVDEVDLTKEIEYAVQKYTTVQMNQGKPRRKFNRMAFCTDGFYQLQDLVTEYVSDIQNTLFIDNTSNPYEQRNSIFKLLKQHIFEHTIKIGRKYYRQKVGIPQGSILSTILCSLYYGHIEKEKLDSITNNPSSMLIRYIDDFLFVSTEKNRVKQFVNIMHQGLEDVGVVISASKTLINFQMCMGGKEIQKCQKNHQFPWCGLLIHPRTLDVMHDYTRISDTAIKNSLTVEFSHSPGKAILTKVKQSLRNLAHPIYLEPSFNGKPCILMNIFQSFLFCALKLGATLDLAFDSNHINPNFVMAVIKEAIVYQISMVRNHGVSTGFVSSRRIAFLGFTSFLLILSKKRNRYGKITALIGKELERFPTLFQRQMDCVIHSSLHTSLLEVRF
jgi:telomerase reverse transcriptase